MSSCTDQNKIVALATKLAHDAADDNDVPPFQRAALIDGFRNAYIAEYDQLIGIGESHENASAEASAQALKRSGILESEAITEAHSPKRYKDEPFRIDLDKLTKEESSEILISRVKAHELDPDVIARSNQLSDLILKAGANIVSIDSSDWDAWKTEDYLKALAVLKLTVGKLTGITVLTNGDNAIGADMTLMGIKSVSFTGPKLSNESAYHPLLEKSRVSGSVAGTANRVTVDESSAVGVDEEVFRSSDVSVMFMPSYIKQVALNYRLQEERLRETRVSKRAYARIAAASEAALTIAAFRADFGGDYSGLSPAQRDIYNRALRTQAYYFDITPEVLSSVEAKKQYIASYVAKNIKREKVKIHKSTQAGADSLVRKQKLSQRHGKAVIAIGIGDSANSLNIYNPFSVKDVTQEKIGLLKNRLDALSKEDNPNVGAMRDILRQIDQAEIDSKSLNQLQGKVPTPDETSRELATHEQRGENEPYDPEYLTEDKSEEHADDVAEYIAHISGVAPMTDEEIADKGSAIADNKILWSQDDIATSTELLPEEEIAGFIKGLFDRDRGGLDKRLLDNASLPKKINTDDKFTGLGNGKAIVISAGIAKSRLSEEGVTTIARFVRGIVGGKLRNKVVYRSNTQAMNDLAEAISENSAGAPSLTTSRTAIKKSEAQITDDGRYTKEFLDNVGFGLILSTDNDAGKMAGLLRARGLPYVFVRFEAGESMKIEYIHPNPGIQEAYSKGQRGLARRLAIKEYLGNSSAVDGFIGFFKDMYLPALTEDNVSTHFQVYQHAMIALSYFHDITVKNKDLQDIHIINPYRSTSMPISGDGAQADLLKTLTHNALNNNSVLDQIAFGISEVMDSDLFTENIYTGLYVKDSVRKLIDGVQTDNQIKDASSEDLSVSLMKYIAKAQPAEAMESLKRGIEELSKTKEEVTTNDFIKFILTHSSEARAALFSVLMNKDLSQLVTGDNTKSVDGDVSILRNALQDAIAIPIQQAIGRQQRLSFGDSSHQRRSLGMMGITDSWTASDDQVNDYAMYVASTSIGPNGVPFHEDIKINITNSGEVSISFENATRFFETNQTLASAIASGDTGAMAIPFFGNRRNAFDQIIVEGGRHYNYLYDEIKNVIGGTVDLFEGKTGEPLTQYERSLIETISISRLILNEDKAWNQPGGMDESQKRLRADAAVMKKAMESAIRELLSGMDFKVAVKANEKVIINKIKEMMDEGANEIGFSGSISSIAERVSQATGLAPGLLTNARQAIKAFTLYSMVRDGNVEHFMRKSHSDDHVTYMPVEIDGEVQLAEILVIEGKLYKVPVINSRGTGTKLETGTRVEGRQELTALEKAALLRSPAAKDKVAFEIVNTVLYDKATIISEALELLTIANPAFQQDVEVVRAYMTGEDTGELRATPGFEVVMEQLAEHIDALIAGRVHGVIQSQLNMNQDIDEASMNDNANDEFMPASARGKNPINRESQGGGFDKRVLDRVDQQKSDMQYVNESPEQLAMQSVKQYIEAEVAKFESTFVGKNEKEAFRQKISAQAMGPNGVYSLYLANEKGAAMPATEESTIRNTVEMAAAALAKGKGRESIQKLINLLQVGPLRNDMAAAMKVVADFEAGLISDTEAVSRASEMNYNEHDDGGISILCK